MQRLKHEHVDTVVFVGDGEDFLGLTQELDRQHLLPMLLVPAGMVGQKVLSIPPRLRSKVVLAAAIDPPTVRDLEELQKLAGQHQVQNFGFSRMAQAAASAFIESLMQVGRHVTRSLLIETLERFREQETGAGFTLTYGPQRRIGSVRIRLFHVSSDSVSFIPASKWLVPQNPS